MASSMQSTDTFEHLRNKKMEPEPDFTPTPSRRAQPAHNKDGFSIQDSGPKVKSHGSHGFISGTWDLSAVRRGMSQLLEGFKLIARSGYLCHVCLHFVLHYIVSTFFYFEKTLVVASSGGSASQRVATFATINSMSAGAVALIQLTATVQHLHPLSQSQRVFVYFFDARLLTMCKAMS